MADHEAHHVFALYIFWNLKFIVSVSVLDNFINSQINKYNLKFDRKNTILNLVTKFITRET